jgi:predicted anti-sigma-YlaC factor YlaD
MQSPIDSIKRMLGMLARTKPVEYSCDDVQRLLDQFAEAVQSGRNAASLWPLVQQHLDNCPDCREEYEALVRILRAGGASQIASS